MKTKTEIALGNITETQEHDRGVMLAAVLGLKRDRTYPDRYLTEWGNKTATGLFRTIAGIVHGEFHNQ